MSKALKNKVKLNDVISVKDFGATGDGVTDDKDALQAAITHIATNGGTLYIPAGTYLLKTAGLSIADFDGFRITGDGMYQTKIVRAATGVGTVLNILRCDRVIVDNIGFDGGLAEFPGGSASHGFVFNDCEHVRGENLYATNFKNGGVNAFVTNGTQKRNIRFIGCEVDGNGVANNGINIANCIDSGMIDCHVRDCPGSPGYGLQLKNVCARSYIKSCVVEGCTAGVAFGNDLAATGVQNCMVSDVSIFNCDVGIITGYASNNTFDTIRVDMNMIVGWGIDLQNGSSNNVFRNIVGQNINTLRSLIRLRLNSNYNNFEITQLANPTINSGTLGTLDIGVTNARINLGQVVTDSYSPWSLLLTDNSANFTNTFLINNEPRTELHSISAGSVTLTCGGVRIVRMDTEDSAATDNLDIMGGNAQDNQIIYLQSSNNARDIVVRDATVAGGGGNIDLIDNGTFTLANVRDSLVLMYKENHGRWVEISRSTVL
jgi:hypothetical protein